MLKSSVSCKCSSSAFALEPLRKSTIESLRKLVQRTLKFLCFLKQNIKLENFIGLSWTENNIFLLKGLMSLSFYTFGFTWFLRFRKSLK